MSGVPKSLGIVKFQGIFPTVRFLYALYTDEVKVTRVMAFQALAIEGSKQYYAYLDQCGKGVVSIDVLKVSCAEGFVFAEQAFHLGGEVHIAIASFRFRSLYDDLVAGRFDGIAADVDAAFGVVDVLPLERTALTAPHPGRNDELEAGFVQDAHGFQRLNQLFHRFIVRNLFLFLLTCVLVSAPSRVMINI